MSWIFEGLRDWMAVVLGDKISGSRRPWVVGLLLVVALLLMAALLRVFFS